MSQAAIERGIRPSGREAKIIPPLDSQAPTE